jgi:Tfp pilus assembly protein PilO
MSNGSKKSISLHQVFDIVIIVVSVAVILFSSVMIGKTISRKKTVEAELQTQERELLNKMNQLNFLKGLKADQAVLDFAHTVSDKYIPQESDETGIVDLITGIITKYGGNMSQIRFDNYVKMSGFSKEVYRIPFSIILTCDYAGLINILDDLSVTERLFVIEKINVIKRDSSPDNTQISVEITGGTFFSKTNG